MRSFLLALAALGLACSGGEPPAPEQPASRSASAAAASPSGPLIVAFGDSLTAGRGVGPEESYPAFLEQELARGGFPHRVANDGVSGDTTAAALARLDLSIARKPDYVILALGANDGLRGLPLDAMERNLVEIIGRFRQAGAAVILAGMKLPPNFGPDYTAQFEAVYARVAEQTGVELIPFLLEGVAAEPTLNQPDGIHPTAEGNRIVAGRVADFLEPMLEGRLE